MNRSNLQASVNPKKTNLQIIFIEQKIKFGYFGNSDCDKVNNGWENGKVMGG